jgi:P-type Ca2+ transporter type 2B
MKTTIEAAIAKMANTALRTIIVARKEIDGENIENKNSKGIFDVETSNLTMIALLGIKDILRQEVPGAI